MKKIAILFALALVLMTACAGNVTPTTIPTVDATALPAENVHTFTAPSYATTYGVLAEVKKELDYSGIAVYEIDRFDHTVGEGLVGIIIDDEFASDAFYNDNYGQVCYFSRDESESYGYNQQTKVLTVNMGTTTHDPKFLSWCEEQIPDKALLYVVSALQSENPDEFIITYTQETWAVDLDFEY